MIGREPTEIRSVLLSQLPVLDQEHIAAGRSVLTTERVCFYLADYIARLVEALRSVLPGIALQLAPHRSNSDGYVEAIVVLRVHGELLQIRLPLELAEEIVCAVLEQEASRLVEQPTEERLAVLAFFAAKLLAEQPLFLGQRIYVAEVRTIAGEYAHRHLCQPLCGLVVRYHETEFRVDVSGTPELLSRIAGYAQLAPDAYRAQRVLALANVSAAFTLSFDAESLLSLINLEPGALLRLPPRVQGLLQWTHPESGVATKHPLQLCGCNEEAQELLLQIVKREDS